MTNEIVMKVVLDADESILPIEALIRRVQLPRLSVQRAIAALLDQQRLAMVGRRHVTRAFG